MNWRYLIGSQLSLLEHAIMHRMPNVRFLPRGRNWLYDARRLLTPDNANVIFDVGANIGQTAWGLSRYFPEANKYCFEPQTKAYSELSKNYGRQKNFNLAQIALGDMDGFQELKVFASSELNTLGSIAKDNHLKYHTEEICVQKLDSFCAQNHIEQIDILKIDVQGWEMQVLAGGKRMIEENRIRIVKAEVEFTSTGSDVTLFTELHAFMDQNGFQLCGFYDAFRWGPQKMYLGFVDAMYVRTRGES